MAMVQHTVTVVLDDCQYLRALRAARRLEISLDEVLERAIDAGLEAPRAPRPSPVHCRATAAEGRRLAREILAAEPAAGPEHPADIPSELELYHERRHRR